MSSELDEDVLANIVAGADDKVRARGESIRRGEIRTPTRDGPKIRARVRGTDVVPYRVDIDTSSGEHSCTCPYDWDEVCKHTVAVALLALSDPEALEESTSKPGAKIDLSTIGEDDAITILEELRKKFPRVVREFVAEEMHEFEYGDPDDDGDKW